MSNMYAARLRHSGDPEVRHDASAQRFIVEIGGSPVGVLDYRLDGDVLDLTHTQVDTKLGGQGLGSMLVKAGLDHARAKGLSVRPTCEFAELYLSRHDEYADLRVAGE